jgi:DNA polymerase I-like protein with 3'-5' exonuclease and polymerase domains
MGHRCLQDVEINRRLYEKYRKYAESPLWQSALKIELSTADFCSELHNNGFRFDIESATKILKGWQSELSSLEVQFQKDFPPKFRAVREIRPTLTKSGKLHSKDFRWADPADLPKYTAGCPFTLIEPDIFSPASKLKVIERLWEHGWVPYNKTKGAQAYSRIRPKDRDPDKERHFARYGWTLDEQNLQTLPKSAPRSAQSLVRWLLLTGLCNQIEGFINNYNPETHKIHAEFTALGAWTHRATHSKPNMANVSKEPDIRRCFTAEPGEVLVGCDAVGIQLRLLGHFMDDPEFIKAVCSGDVHTMNWDRLRPACTTRDDAKTFIYAFVLGATAPKVATIFKCDRKTASRAIDTFIEAYPGLKRLKTEVIPQDARRGWFHGLDGRVIRQSEERLILAGYLQGGEKVVMALGRMLAKPKLKGVPHRYVNWVHDEFQISTPPEFAEFVGRTQAEAIAEAGRVLGLKAPMAGDFKIGKNWYETH